MVDVGDDAPDFTVPVARDDIESFSLSTHLDEAPLVLAFFPAAFSSTCTAEMDSFQERLDRFTEAGAAVYGVSTDSPFALSAFRADRGLDFGLLSDYDRDLIDAYDLRTDFDAYGIHGLAADGHLDVVLGVGPGGGGRRHGRTGGVSVGGRRSRPRTRLRRGSRRGFGLTGRADVFCRPSPTTRL